jgi:hypothetical protein
MSASPAKALRVVGLFGLLGLACGLFSSWVRAQSAVTGNVGNEFPIMAAVFGVALFLGAFIGRRLGWTKARPSVGIFIAIIVWLTVTYVAAMFLFFEVGHLLEVLFTRAVTNESALLVPWAMFAVAGIASVTAVSVALRFLTGIWDRKAYLWFLVGGVIAWPVTSLMMHLRGDRLMYTSLYIVTQSLAGLASGYWFFRASERTPTAS